jgi:hypothetical protein
VLGSERAVVGLVEAQRVGRAPAVELAHQPVRSARVPARDAPARRRPARRSSRGSRPTIGHVGDAVLADLGRVDVGVDDRRARREAVELAGDAVVEARAEAMSRSLFCRAVTAATVPCMPGHAEVLRVAVGERAAGHERRDDRDAGQLGEHAQLGGGARLEHAAADVQHRALRAAMSRAASRICLACGRVVGR